MDNLVCKNGLWGIVENDGFWYPEIVAPQYDAFINTSYNDIFRTMRQGKYGLITRFGRIIADTEYDLIGNFNSKRSFCPVRRNEKWGFIDYSGNLVIDCKYDYITDFDGYPNIRKWSFAVLNGRRYEIRKTDYGTYEEILVD